MRSPITIEFARRDDCLDQMVPSELRVLVTERDTLRTANQRLEGEVARLRAEVEKLDTAPKLYEAVERACDELPEGWAINVCMESGAGWIELYDDEGVQIEDFPTNNERLDYTLNDAIDAALRGNGGE
jgi:hypothetical protein